MGNITGFGPVIDGSANDDVIIVQESGTGGFDTVNAGGGDDVVIADHAALFVDSISNISIGSSISIDDAAFWSIKANPDVADPAVPYTSVLSTGTGGADFYAVTIGAGQTITLDIDRSSGIDSYIELVDINGNVLTANDDQDDGGPGGSSTDSFVSYTAGKTATYFIHVSNLGSSTVPSGATYMLNVSVTGHAATNSSVFDIDTVYGEAGDDILYGLDGDDSLNGGSGSDVLYGGAGDDVLQDSKDSAADVFEGGAGDDRLYVVANGGHSDFIDHAGNDSISATVSIAGWTIDLENHIGFSTGATLSITGEVENAIGSTFDDVLTASAAGSTLSGSGGNDILNGGAGNDIVEGGFGDDTMAGGGGVDTLSYENASGGVSVNLALTGPQNMGNSGIDTISGFENVLGTSYVDFLSGNAADNELHGGGGNDTLSGGKGNDLLDGGDSTGDLATYINATAGVQVSLAIAGAQDTLGDGIDTLVDIENLQGSNFNDRLTGDTANNKIDGGTGADRMEGGAGSDTYTVDNAGDVVIEADVDGYDRVNTSVSWSLVGQFIEAMTATGAGDINLVGNGLDNILTGNDGANRLNGGAGSDTMTGGLGNDRYYVDSAGDTLFEKAGEGSDSVESTISFSLAGRNIENLKLVGSDAIDGTGDNGVNQLLGNSNKNILDGGAGADDMRGGKGDDTYYVDNAGDQVIELDGGGSDTVNASVSYSIAGQFVEVLNLTGADAINGTGNGLNNRIIGNGAANVLTGGAGNDRLDGGAGADKMAGGTGNDTYVIDNAGDVIVENDGEGIDTVEASFSYSIAGQFIETLTLTGSGNINGTGNGLANVLNGNGGNNTLNGGAGADDMTGGAGDDVYIVDNAGDRVFEVAGGGTDTVQSAVSFAIGGQYVEAVVLTGNAAINATGNSQANILTGNAAVNSLSGGGGADQLHGGLGSDTLIGGAGADTYWFETTLGAGNVDKIADFAAEDTINLDRSIFTGIAADGALAASAFHLGTAAHDADDRIVYDAATGKIWYDADGSGAGTAVLFAQVTAHTTLTAADFFAVA